MCKFLLVEHDGILDEFIFKKAVERGLDLFLVSNNLENWILKYVKKENIIITNTDDPDCLISSVKAFISDRNICFSGVGTFFERFVINTAMLAESLKLTGLPVESALQSSCHKFKMRAACKNKNILQPDFESVRLDEYEKINRFLLNHKISVIKPVSGAGSIGVHKLELNSDINKIKDKIESQLKSDDNNYVKTNIETFLIEEYISGGLFSVDGLIQNNKIFFIGETEFYMGKEPLFIQEGGITPIVSYSDEQIINAQKMANQIVTALGFNNCGFHCEMRMTKNGPVLIEVAARPPGGPLLLNYDNAYGIDGVSLMFDIWLGKEITVSKNKNKYLIHKDVFAQKNGIVRSIVMPEKLKDKEGLIDIIFFANVGDNVNKRSNEALYYYSVVGQNLSHACQLSKEVENLIVINID